jgi:SET domain-containing protein
VRELKAEPRAVAGKGRGLFAAAPIAQGEIIDRACSVLLSGDQCLALDEMRPLGEYYFAHPEDRNYGLIVLGLPSLCNYADDPNGHIEWRGDDELGWVAELVARKDIPAGEEITSRYRCGPWFEQA